jgi:hypothetical protein
MKLNNQILIITIIMVVVAALRLLTNQLGILPNFAPIAAIGLFGAVYLKNKNLAVLLPLTIMLATDAIIGFHRQSLSVYAGFLSIVMLGFLLRNNFSFKNLIRFSLLSSVVFFVISNFGVWLVGGYNPTAAGLMECYIQAIPFFGNTIAGDLFYSLISFGAFEFYKTKYMALQKPH